MHLERRIRRDARLVAGDAEAAALLACLAQHVFDPDLDATFLARVCGASQQVRRRLAAAVGPLKAYVTELRMTEAARLVRDTDLPQQEIGKRVGYRLVRTFRRVFKENHGVTAGAMRLQARAETSPDAAMAAAGVLARQEMKNVDDAQRLAPRATAARLRRRTALGLEPERTGELREQLRRRHPSLATAGGDRAQDRAGSRRTGSRRTGSRRTGSRQTGSRHRPPAEAQVPLLLTPASLQLETIAAAAVFGRILELPEGDLRHAMRDGVRIGTSTAFDVLRELCYDLARWDTRRAVTVAELGVQLIETHREVMGEQGDDRMALAWAFLARVQILAGDFGATERALGFAWQEVTEGSGGQMAPWAEIEVRRVEGILRMHLGRGADAARALDRAMELGRGLGPCHPHRIRALGERLEVASLQGDAETALPLCDELEELTRECASGIDRALWHGTASYHRGKARAAAGCYGEAETCLLQAAAHIAADPEAAVSMFELALLGSFVLHELARLAGRGGDLDEYDLILRGVLDRYQRLGTPILQATAEAELAALCALRGAADEARQRAAAAADFLDHLPGHRRAWSVARRLRLLANGDAEAAEAAAAEAAAAEATGVRPKGDPRDSRPQARTRGIRKKAGTHDIHPKLGKQDSLATFAAELDALRWEITGVQAGPAAGRRGPRPIPTRESEAPDETRGARAAEARHGEADPWTSAKPCG